MTARDDLIKTLQARSIDSGWDDPEDMQHCVDLVNAYAHELAEQVRAYRFNAWHGDTNALADLIDPETE